MALFQFLVFSLCILCCKVDARHKTLPNEQIYFSTSNSPRAQVDNEFDCVDIYMQPALQHPSLKNHKIQLYPTFAKNVVRNRPSHDGECSAQKVPIYKRARKHQIVTNSSSKLQIDQNIHGYYIVSLDTTQNVMNEGYAKISLYNLSLEVGQLSTSSVWVESGPPEELNSIHVGVTVHPGLYGDSQLRLTSSWHINHGRLMYDGCNDILCPGFVQVSPDKSYAFGSVKSPTTPIGSSAKKYVIAVKIQRDKSTGHWWLVLDDLIEVGYWPKELFTHLSTGASKVRFASETYASPGLLSPPMGSGRLPKEGYENSALFGDLMTIDSNFFRLDVLPQDMTSYNDANTNCYDLLYNEYSGTRYRQTFLYGGPGGANCN